MNDDPESTAPLSLEAQLPCAGPRCKELATHYPVLLLVPTKGYRGHPWKVQIQVPFCPKHCLKDAEQYLTDPFWLQLIARAKERGHLPPRRSLTRVEFTLIVPAKEVPTC
jgi:hypothetical protein